jgi:hypothetical protein
MTRQTRLKLLLPLLTPLCVQASTITLYDEEFLFQVNGVAVTPGTYAARLGTLEAGVFSPLVDDGFMPEPSATSIAQIGGAPSSNLLGVMVEKNSNFDLPFGTQLALAITTLNASADFALSSPSNTLILEDPSWTIAMLQLFGPDYTFGFTSSTHVELLNGQDSGSSFSYNGGGSEVLNLSTIPEPGTSALAGGLAALSLAGFQRRRRHACRG